MGFIQSGQKDMLVFNTFFFCKPSYLAEPLALPGTALQILLLLGEKVNDSASKFVYTTWGWQGIIYVTSEVYINILVLAPKEKTHECVPQNSQYTNCDDCFSSA